MKIKIIFTILDFLYFHLFHRRELFSRRKIIQQKRPNSRAIVSYFFRAQFNSSVVNYTRERERERVLWNRKNRHCHCKSCPFCLLASFLHDIRIADDGGIFARPVTGKLPFHRSWLLFLKGSDFSLGTNYTENNLKNSA